MDTWKQRVDTSPALTHSNEIKNKLAELDDALITTETQDYIERTEVVVDTVLDRLTNTDPRLINNSALTNIGSKLANVSTYLTNWVQGSGETYLTSSAQSELDEVVGYLADLSPGMDVPAAREAVSSLRRSVGRNRAIVEQVIQDVQQKGTDADATIDEKVEEVKKDFSTLEESIEELDTDLKAIQTASTQVATEQQTAFTKAEAARSTTFNEMVTEKQKDLTASLNTLKTDAGTAVEEIRKNVEKDEEAAGAARARVEEILGIVGEEALIGDYAKNARDEKKVADLWRWITALSIVGALGFAVWLASSATDVTAWQRIVTKTVVVIAFGGLAGYAARQSSEHRTAQREAERMALQLKALKPYLNDIDDETKRDDLLAKIADRLFGNTQPLIKIDKSGKSKNQDDNPILTAQLLEAVIELVKRSKP